MAKQNFRRYQFVHVYKVKDGHMSVNGGFPGIVSGSYSDQYGGRDIHSYTIYKLKVSDEAGKPAEVVDCCSWYEDWQLVLMEVQDQDLAADMIEAYNFKNTPDNSVEDDT